MEATFSKLLIPSFSGRGTNLKVEHLLRTKYNATLEEVWNFVPRFRNQEPFNLEICFILTLPIKQVLNGILNVSID